MSSTPTPLVPLIPYISTLLAPLLLQNAEKKENEEEVCRECDSKNEEICKREGVKCLLLYSKRFTSKNEIINKNKEKVVLGVL